MRHPLLILLAVAVVVSLGSGLWAAIAPALPLAKAALSNPLYAGVAGLAVGLALGSAGKARRRR